MYIAFKWLVCMAVAMWITLCAIEYHNRVHNNKAFADIDAHINLLPLLENTSILVQQNSLESTKNIYFPIQQNENILLQYMMFVAGSCLVIIYNRKNDFIMYTKRNIEMTMRHKNLKLWCKGIFSKNIAKRLRFSISKIFESNTCIFKYLFLMFKPHSKRRYQNINLILLNKLRECGQERRNLGHLLIAAIQENKNLRMLYQLETMAKNRLVRNIENTQQQIKKNRSQYVSFQQLYLITHQENIFLKARIKKLSQDKEEAERNLVKLVNHVWLSKNKELQAYCSRFIVQTRNNLLNSDVRAEIDQFVKKSPKIKQVSPKKPFNPMHLTNTVNDIIGEEGIVALVKDAPKLRGLPGEYVWTVKDKDGIIEKLYEYETDFDNGDTVKRIREYSVYYDKDCLLDFTSSTTLIHNRNVILQRPNKRNISGSQAFQKFLENNRNAFYPRRSPLSITI